MFFNIQDPYDSKSNYLLESLLSGCEDATQGGGTFAFASSSGINLFFKDPSFQKFASSGSFELIVGCDAITNPSALEAIQDLQKVYPKLSAKAFLSDKPKSLYHPKFTWFKKGDGGVLITGSGNLTRGGLRGNVEAYSITELNASEFKSLEEQWNNFLVGNATRLFDLQDQRVIDQAELNRQRERAKLVIDENDDVPPIDPEDDTSDDDNDIDEVVRPSDTDAVLVAEIPASGGRWKQANFTKGIYKDYFGVTPGIQHRVFFYHVEDGGILATLEIRPGVEVESNNFRFELDAASGKDYPTEGRPVGVFIRTATRTFLYRLVMPTDTDYGSVDKILAGASVPARELRRIIIDVATLRKQWPTAPFWHI